MKHLIVVAHPAAHSFTMGLARAYAAELEELGHSQRTCDLYRMGFNPVLSAQELAAVSADHAASPDVAQAQEDIRAADALTVIYPLWWLSMPAMMKGYIDRVFARGFAYESHDGGQRLARRLNGSAAIDPTATLAVHCGNGFDVGFSPYQSARLSRYNPVS